MVRYRKPAAERRRIRVGSEIRVRQPYMLAYKFRVRAGDYYAVSVGYLYAVTGNPRERYQTYAHIRTIKRGTVGNSGFGKVNGYSGGAFS
jgi:hypothetical protein